MVIGTKISDWLKIPRLRLKPDSSACVGCEKCTEKCPMSLDVKGMVVNGSMKNSECILCGECVDACPKKAVLYSFGNKL